uniref:Coiled-coil domain-containing protein 102A-like n=1 Tax=Phallusia mammillata TaxID=59560 RepID=A0A6F9D7P8_9ASCI|nr:coiled-coil domain-containing protein 102A-like [Phallusia mammillata]
MASAAMVPPTAYYRINLGSSCVTVDDNNSSHNSIRDDLSSKGEDIASEIRAKSPGHRSWFDDATANSLERHSNSKRRMGRSSPRSVSSGPHTLPRSAKLSNHSLDGSVCDKPWSGYSTPNAESTISSCDNINLALNNSLRQEPRYEKHNGIDRSMSPYGNRTGSVDSPRRTSPVQRHTTDGGHELRNRSYSPSLLAAVKENDASGSTLENIEVHPDKCPVVEDENDVKLTRDLLNAMRELKDIAEVSRVIDEVDDEEWLLMFIGELDSHLRDLVRMDIARQNRHEQCEECDPQEELELQRIERNEKATMLSVALDLIRYLKDRSTYALHRRSSRNPDKEGDNGEGSYGTLGRLKVLAAEKPSDPACMNKWQRRLSNLAGTLDKYLQRLESVTVFQINIESHAPPKTNENVPTDNHFYGTDSPDSGKKQDPFKSTAEQNGLKANQPKAKTRKLGKVTTSTPKSRHDSRPITPNHVEQMRAMFDGGSPVENKPKALSRKKSSSGDSGYEEKLLSHRTTSSGSENDMFEAKKCVYAPIQVKSNKRIATNLTGDREKPNRTKPSTEKLTNQERNVHPRQTTANEKPKAKGRKSDPIFQDTGKTDQKNKVEERGRKATRSEDQDAGVHHMSGYCRLPTRNRHNRGGSLDRQTWKNEWKGNWSGKARDDSTLVSKDLTLNDGTRHVSGYCRLPDYSRSLSGPETTANTRKVEKDGRQISEFRMTIGIDQPTSAHKDPSPIERKEEHVILTVLEQDLPTNAPCRNHTRGTSAYGNMFTRNDSKDSSKPKKVTSSVQCSILSNDNVEKADREITKLKKRSDLLQRGLTEAREERDEKDRRIAVLESRVQRLKKNMEQGRTEQGSVQEELLHLRKLLNQERRDAQLQIAEMENKLKSIESKLAREKEKIVDLNNKIEQLQTDNVSLRKKCDDLTKDKNDLEQQLHEATMTLLREKRNSRRLQLENQRLEEELSRANASLSEEKENKSRMAEQVHDLIISSEAIVEEVAIKNGSETYEVDPEEMEQLQDENYRLTQENGELRENLEKEQDLSAATSDCFRQQVEFLSNEVSMQKEASRAQKEQYESEIERLLKSKDVKIRSTSTDEMEYTTLTSQIEYEQTITRTLYIENERLRKERDELLDKLVQIQTDGKEEPETAEFGCQYDDTSYTRMRAFDFYAQEAHRDAKKLVDRGRQLQEEGLKHSMRTQRLQVELRRKHVM